MQVSVGAIKISHAFHFELLVNVSMPSTNCQEPCREQVKWGPPLLFLLPPYRSTHSLTILSSHPEANNSWQAFPKMVPRPRNSCNTIQHSTYVTPVVWALSPSRVAGGGGPGIPVCRMRALAFVVDVFELCCKGFLVLVC